MWKRLVLIGVDFDNTIVCYDELFQRLAVERGLVPSTTPASKGAVRDELRRAGREELWTELQGEVYGGRMLEARAFPGVLEFFRGCRERGVATAIISHRSQYPYRGTRHDLHEAARNWIDAFAVHDPSRVFLELTKEDKIARIAASGCTHFIDDLPELLAEPGFPAHVSKILFDPNGQHAEAVGVRRLTSWTAMARALLPEEAR